MSSHMRHRSETHRVSNFVSRFSGRQGYPGYDGAKFFRLHARQRAFVWKKNRWMKLKDSMVKGLYIPPIICNEYFDADGVKRCDIMEGGNRATTMSMILKGSVCPLTDDEKRRIEDYEIEIVFMNNLSIEDQCEMFSRLNNSVKVGDGAKFAMWAGDSFLVKYCVGLLTDADYPLREQITRAWFNTVTAYDKDKGKVDLANTVAIVSGIINGPHYVTKSFEKQELKVRSLEPIDHAKVVDLLGVMLNIFEQAENELPLNNLKKQKALWNVGGALGAIIYDLTMNPDRREQLIHKWVKWLVAVRRGDRHSDLAIKVGSAQNIKPDTLKRKCYKVNKFLETGELATDDELKVIKHGVDNDDEDDDEDDIYSDSNE